MELPLINLLFSKDDFFLQLLLLVKYYNLKFRIIENRDRENVGKHTNSHFNRQLPHIRMGLQLKHPNIVKNPGQHHMRSADPPNIPGRFSIITKHFQ